MVSNYDDEDWQSSFDEVEAEYATAKYKRREMLRVHAYDDRRTNTPVDWASVLSGELPERQYVAGDLFEIGQQVSLIGEGKVGKSLLAVDLVRALSTGRPFLGAPKRPPIHVGYLDMENDLRTLAERAIAFGMTADDFANVTYLSFPSIAPLDTPIGGEMLMEEVEKWQMKCVVLDTVSRFIEGRENDADTWLAFYRCTGVHLKANNVALLRLDHMGKDATRGGRGSSAKTQDVDHVYELSESSGKGPGKHLLLRRTFTRSGGGAEERKIVRLSKWDDARRQYLPGETRHVYQGESIAELPLALPESAPALPTLTARASEMVDSLDRLGVAHDASTRTCGAILRGDGQTVSKNDIAEACRFRKKRGPVSTVSRRPGHPTGTPPGHFSSTSDRDTDRDTTGTPIAEGSFSSSNPPGHFDRDTGTVLEKSQAEGVPVQSTGALAPALPEHPEGPVSRTRSIECWPTVPLPDTSDDE